MSEDTLILEGNKTRLMALVLRALQHGNVTLSIDAADPGVVVPQQHVSDGFITLTYGLNMPKPIPDLQVDSAGVMATFSFAGEWIQTFIPWSAVRNIFYENPLPVLSAAELDAIAAAAMPAAKPARRLRRITAIEEYRPDTTTVEEMSTEFDRVKTEEEFKTFGLRSVK